MGVHELDQFLLIGAAVLIAAVLAVRLSVRSGLPSLLLYLGLGLLIGSSGLGIQFADAELAHALGWAALVVILTEGGLTTSWRAARPSLGPGLALATVGSTVSVLVMAPAAHYLWASTGSWPFSWAPCLLRQTLQPCSPFCGPCD